MCMQIQNAQRDCFSVLGQARDRLSGPIRPICAKEQLHQRAKPFLIKTGGPVHNQHLSPVLFNWHQLVGELQSEHDTVHSKSILSSCISNLILLVTNNACYH